MWLLWLLFLLLLLIRLDGDYQLLQFVDSLFKLLNSIFELLNVGRLLRRLRVCGLLGRIYGLCLDGLTA